MFRRIIVIMFVLCTSVGCSVYDVVALSTDAALELFTDVNDGKSSRDNDPNNDPYRFWNSETSSCIRTETERNDLQQQLDAAFDAIEEDQDFVLLPTGEKYAINEPSSHEEPSVSPTALCLAQESD